MIRRFTCRSGSTIHIDDSGRGVPLLAVHGLGGGAWFFSGLARRLAEIHRVIAVDLPGTGRSDASLAGMSIGGWVQDLGDLVVNDIGEPVVLVGHSMSTIIALEAALAWPGQIRAIVFAGGLPEPRDEVRTRLAARAESLERDGIAGTGAAVARANFSPATIQRDPEMVGLFERLIDGQDPIRYAHCCRVLMNASAAAAPPRVTMPCLSISGTDDGYAPPDLVADFVGRLPAASQELLAECGHFPFLEQPAAFAALVRSFVDRVF